MKKIIIIPLTILSYLSTYPMDRYGFNNKAPMACNPTINITHSGNNTVTGSNESKNANSASATQTVKVKLDLPQFPNLNITAPWQWLSGWISNNKYLLIGGCIATMYGYLFYKLAEGNRYTQKKNLWSRWHTNNSIKEYEAIAQELLIEIQQRHMSSNNPTDFFYPLVSFMQTIEYEINTLEHHINLLNAVITLRGNYLLPAHHSTRQRAKELLKNARTIKHTFTTWAAQNNIAKESQLKQWVRNKNIDGMYPNPFTLSSALEKTYQ